MKNQKLIFASEEQEREKKARIKTKKHKTADIADIFSVNNK